MKKLITLTIFMALIICIYSLNAGASPVTVWWDVKGITDKNAISPPGPGDLLPDTKVDLIPCQKVWLDLYVSGIPQPGITNFDFNLFYDSNQFTYDPPNHPSFKLNTQWEYFNPYIEIGDGYIYVEGGAQTGVGIFGDNIEIALVDFHCKKVGEPYTLEFEFFNIYKIKTGEKIPIEYIPLTINNVPIPPTLILLGSGLLGVIGLRRKFRF